MKALETKSRISASTLAQASELFAAHRQSIYQSTDRMFAVLMSIQWIAGIAAALLISPRTWAGAVSQTHIHVWAAIFVGGAINLFPIVLIIKNPGALSTRYVVATAQILMSALLIHLTGGRIETHFHVFGSLAFLAFYRDWRVLVPATIVVAADHFLRGVFWPQSVYGVLSASQWRWLEHAGWVLFEDTFLFIAIRRSVGEMWGIAQRTAELNDNEERYRAVVEQTAEGLVLDDVDTKHVLECNAAFAKLLGYTLQEALSLTAYDFVVDEREAIDRRSGNLLERRLPMTGESRFRKKDDSIIEVEVNVSVIFYGGKDVFCTIVRDISERKRAEEKRMDLLQSEQEARRKAEEASRLKDEFLATVSHELRTPLTAVVGWSHMLLAGQLDQKGTADALEAIARNARSQTQLIDDLLDVSRIITGRLRLDVTAVAPAALINAAIEAVRPAAEAKGVRIQKIVDTGVGSIAGDEHRLQQIVWNLLSNAIKFTSRTGRVQIRLQRVNSSIEIAVSDSGSGISPEFLPYVFDRFRQADMSTTRHHGGLGLGLAIVRHLTELHGGTVHAESAGEGQGSTFTIRLPLVSVYQKDDSAERVHPAARRINPLLECPERLDNLKVLVVDDEADTRDVLRAMLGQCGAEVITADSTAAALSLLEQVKPDVLVSDIGMPVEDGYELIRKVRALSPERGGGIPAVALTAYARAEDRLRTLRAGYQMHIPKPVEIAELVAIVANIAGRYGRS